MKKKISIIIALFLLIAVTPAIFAIGQHKIRLEVLEVGTGGYKIDDEGETPLKAKFIDDIGTIGASCIAGGHYLVPDDAFNIEPGGIGRVILECGDGTEHGLFSIMLSSAKPGDMWEGLGDYFQITWYQEMNNYKLIKSMGLANTIFRYPVDITEVDEWYYVYGWPDKEWTISDKEINEKEGWLVQLKAQASEAEEPLTFACDGLGIDDDKTVFSKKFVGQLFELCEGTVKKKASVVAKEMAEKAKKIQGAPCKENEDCAIGSKCVKFGEEFKCSKPCKSNKDCEDFTPEHVCTGNHKSIIEKVCSLKGPVASATQKAAACSSDDDCGNDFKCVKGNSGKECKQSCQNKDDCEDLEPKHVCKEYSEITKIYSCSLKESRKENVFCEEQNDCAKGYACLDLTNKYLTKKGIGTCTNPVKIDFLILTNDPELYNKYITDKNISDGKAVKIEIGQSIDFGTYKNYYVKISHSIKTFIRKFNVLYEIGNAKNFYNLNNTSDKFQSSPNTLNSIITCGNTLNGEITIQTTDPAIGNFSSTAFWLVTGLAECIGLPENSACNEHVDCMGELGCDEGKCVKGAVIGLEIKKLVEEIKKAPNIPAEKQATVEALAPETANCNTVKNAIVLEENAKTKATAIASCRAKDDILLVSKLLFGKKYWIRFEDYGVRILIDLTKATITGGKFIAAKPKTTGKGEKCENALTDCKDSEFGQYCITFKEGKELVTRCSQILKSGEECFWYSSCESQKCEGANATELIAGKCAEKPQCTENGDCVAGTYCNTAGKCENLKEKGNLCESYTQCKSGLDCITFKEGDIFVNKCNEDLENGAECFYKQDCKSGKCESSGDGQPKKCVSGCFIDSECSSPLICVGEYVTITNEKINGECKKPLSENDDCKLGLGDCANGLYCDNQCKPQKSQGDVCKWTFECSEGLGCVSKKVSDKLAYSCQQTHNDGEKCYSPWDCKNLNCEGADATKLIAGTCK